MKIVKFLSPILLLCLGGCASEVVRYQTDLSIIDQQSTKKYVCAQQTLIRLDSGYERTIKAGTEFVPAGTVKQGMVLKPTNTIFTIEGAHMHEAYPVVDNGRIVGFYLPVERAFSPLSQPVNLSIQEGSQ